MRFDNFLNASKLFLANLFPSGLFHVHPNFGAAVINRKVVAMKKVTGTVIFPLFLYTPPLSLLFCLAFFLISNVYTPNYARMDSPSYAMYLSSQRVFNSEFHVVQFATVQS